MDLSGPDAIDRAIDAGIDLNGSPLPAEMLTLYRLVHLVALDKLLHKRLLVKACKDN